MDEPELTERSVTSISVSMDNSLLTADDVGGCDGGNGGGSDGGGAC